MQVDTTLKKSGEYMDSGKQVFSSKVNSQKDLHQDNVKWFHEARGKYGSSVVGAVDYIKKEGFQGTAQTAVGLVANALEDAKQLPAYLGKESQVRPAVLKGPLITVACCLRTRFLPAEL